MSNFAQPNVSDQNGSMWPAHNMTNPIPQGVVTVQGPATMKPSDDYSKNFPKKTMITLSSLQLVMKFELFSAFSNPFI